MQASRFKQKTEPKRDDDVSLEEEEQSFISYFCGPVNSEETTATAALRFPSQRTQTKASLSATGALTDLLSIADELWPLNVFAEALLIEACADKHISKVRRHQGASHLVRSLLCFIFLWRSNECTRVHGS